jgi:chromosome segregation ATPase
MKRQVESIEKMEEDEKLNKRENKQYKNDEVKLNRELENKRNDCNRLMEKIENLRETLFAQGVIDVNDNLSASTCPELLEINEELQQIQHKSQEISPRLNELVHDIREMLETKAGLEKKVVDKRERLKALNSKKDQTLEEIRKNNLDTFRAVQWFRSVDKSQFEGRVFEPIALNINVTDQRFMQAVESVIGRDALMVGFLFYWN